MKLSILVPAYNEEATIKELLNLVIDVPLSIDKEIIVVDDGSNDRTAEIVEEVKESTDIPINLIQKKNGGKGSAIIEGINYCTGDITIIQDADLEYDPKDYQSIINPILKDTADVVYGSRWLNKENMKQGFKFYIGGKGITWITNFLFPQFPITDEATCYKCFKTKILKEFKLEKNDFAFCPEVTAKLSKTNYRFKEVPIQYYPRSIDEGKKIRVKDGFIAIKTLLDYSDVMSQMFRFLLIGGSGALINLGLLFLFTDIFGLYYLLAEVIGLGISAIWTFTMYRMWAFKGVKQ